MANRKQEQDQAIQESVDEAARAAAPAPKPAAPAAPETPHPNAADTQRRRTKELAAGVREAKELRLRGGSEPVAERRPKYTDEQRAAAKEAQKQKAMDALTKEVQSMSPQELLDLGKGRVKPKKAPKPRVGTTKVVTHKTEIPNMVKGPEVLDTMSIADKAKLNGGIKVWTVDKAPDIKPKKKSK